jgi:hypothetical protein
MNYPYQLVAFISPDPAETPHPPIGTPIYGGSLGWIPNVAIKRRFSVNGIDESSLIAKISDFCANHAVLGLTFTRVIKPEHMPESVIEISKASSLTQFHNDFIAYMGDLIESKFPEREGLNYYPHITITWRGNEVIKSEDYFPLKPPAHLGTRSIKEICLVKDIEDENSQVVAYFNIKGK